MELVLASVAGQLGDLVVGAVEHEETDVALFDPGKLGVHVPLPDTQGVQD